MDGINTTLNVELIIYIPNTSPKINLKDILPKMVNYRLYLDSTHITLFEKGDN